MFDVTPYLDRLQGVWPYQRRGVVVRVVGLSVEVRGLRLSLGELCHIYPADGGDGIAAEVVGFTEDRLLLAPFAELRGVRPGSLVAAGESLFTIPVGPELLGRVLDGLGRPLDRLGPLAATQRVPLSAPPPHPLQRGRIVEPLETGVRAIDGFITCGRGQRIGIFAGSGVGKSTMLGMIARHAASDVNVIALIGERGREVQEFIDHDLGPAGLARSVVVVSTSDQPAPLRMKAAWIATAIAEHFRDQGCAVSLMMDSVTRFAMAQREVGLTAGEPPALKGYPPSVFALLPRLLERAGAAERGSITGFYTVLVEGDDLTEPIADTVRSILDGHIELTRELATQNHYPAINILGSISRLMRQVTNEEHQQLAGQLRDLMASYRNARDLIDIGAYVAGSNPQIDLALMIMPALTAFLRQGPAEPSPLAATVGQMLRILLDVVPGDPGSAA